MGAEPLEPSEGGVRVEGRFEAFDVRLVVAVDRHLPSLDIALASPSRRLRS